MNGLRYAFLADWLKRLYTLDFSCRALSEYATDAAVEDVSDVRVVFRAGLVERVPAASSLLWESVVVVADPVLGRISVSSSSHRAASDACRSG